MFDAQTYKDRRNNLRQLVKSGLIIILGNHETPMNYLANGFPFRQDSTFSYLFGLEQPNLVGVLDIESGKDHLFGNDVDMEDIIWMGKQPAMSERAAQVGVAHTQPLSKLMETLKQAQQQGRTIHFTPPYRGENFIQLQDLLGIAPAQAKKAASAELIKAIVKLRSIKSVEEIIEINKAIDVAHAMHTSAIRMAKPGQPEHVLSAMFESIALLYSYPISFPVILSMNGHILHNHYHGNILEEGRLIVADSGCETPLHYASDITRTFPVSKTFTQKQKEIYEIVLAANMKAIELIRPNVPYKHIHKEVSLLIATELKNLGLMKGDVAEAVEQGAHALFFPHGLGHMMGLDVHDMEGLGENFVGYDEEITRSEQFGTAYLRLGRRLQTGFVITVEPGIYFIPELIGKWQAEKKFTDFINYQALESYYDAEVTENNFGGIRIEDDILVTKDGCEVLGTPIPKTVAEIEELRNFES